MPTCKKCSTGFEITDRDKRFYTEMAVPEPTLCPNCRQQRRLSFRNERNWYKRTCDLTGEPVISIYSPGKPFKIYSQKAWWGDKWDALEYGRDFDFNQPFFPQFRKLQLAVPRAALFNTNSENSEYTTHCGDNRNCYMCCDVGKSEDVYYSNWVIRSKGLVDCTQMIDGELCYECLDCEKLYSCFYCQDCKNCSESHLLYDCRDCRSCVGCAGLRNKENYLFNQLSDAQTVSEYQKKLDSPEFLAKAKGQLEKLKLKTPRLFMHATQSENVSGEYVEQSKNVHDSYHMSKGRDCRFITESAESNDCYDCHSIWMCERLYEFQANITAVNSMFCNLCYDAANLLYCDHCLSCQDCFGCVGLNHKKYCILNKQYSKEEYESLLPRLIEHMRKTKEWGEFFPMEFSPFDYSESIANDYFPMGEGKPAETDKPFKVIEQELKFYKEHGLPVPILHPEERYRRRVALRNPRKLWDRACMKCGTAIRTTYAQDRLETVYCEKCYLGEVY